MAKNELFDVLRLLSKEELKKFRKFLASPYFGKRYKALRLYNEVIKYYPMFTHINLNSKRLAEKISQGKKLKESYVRNLLSDLHEAVLDFMRVENFERSDLDKYIFLFHELKVKGLYREYEKILKKLDSKNNGKTDWLYFLNHHFIEVNKFNFSYHTGKLKKEENISQETQFLNNAANNLVYFFLCSMVSIYINFLSYKKSYNIKTRHNIDKILDMINFSAIKQLMSGEKNSYIVKLYSEMVLLFKYKNNHEYFYKYKKLLGKHIHKLSVDEISVNYNMLLNYCTMQSLFSQNKKSAEFDFNKEQFTLYREMLKNEYYRDRNTHHLPHELYRNILFHGIRIRNYEWLEGFVRKYSFKVFPSDRENMFYYGSAYLHYNTGNFSKALDNINNIEQDFFIYKIDIKNLTLMTYYELGYTENAISLLKAYKEQVRNNKLLTEERQIRYLNFAKYFDKLILYKAGTLRQDISYIKHHLELDDTVAYKNWLVEKISFADFGLKKSA